MKLFAVTLAIALLVPAGLSAGSFGSTATNDAVHASYAPSYSSGGFVYETLLLNNDSLVRGNYIREFNGVSPLSIYYDRFSGEVYVSYSNSNEISVYNGTTLNFIQNITLPFNSGEFEVDSESGQLIVYSQNSNTIYFLNRGNSIVANVTESSSPVYLVYDSSTNTIYWVNVAGSAVLVNATDFVNIKSISLVTIAILYDPVDGNVYALNLNGTSTDMLVIRNNSVIGTFPVNGIGLFMSLDLYDNILLVSSTPGIVEYNASSYSYLRTIPVPNYQPFFGVFYCEGNGYVYAISESFGQLSVYDINGTHLTTFGVGPGPLIEQGGITYDKASKELLVVDTLSDSVSVIPLNIYSVDFIENGLQTGTSWGVTFANSTKDSTNTSISFVTGNGSYDYTISVPVGYVADKSNGTVNISGDGANINLYFVTPTLLYQFRVYSVGLSPGAEWTVTIGNVSQSAFNTAINSRAAYQSMNFYLPEGNYNYSVKSQGYRVVKPYPISYSWPNPGPNFDSLSNLSSSGILSVPSNDFAAYFRVATFKVVFHESGLANGTYWYVYINGNQYLENTSTISTYLPNGSYNYTIGTTGGMSLPVLPHNGVNGYNSSGINGTVVVNSEGKQIDLQFIRDHSYVFANFTFLKYPSTYPQMVTIGNITEYSNLNQNLSFLVPKGEISAHILSIIHNNNILPNFETELESWIFSYSNFSAEKNVQINVTFHPPRGYFPVYFIFPDNSPEPGTFILLENNQSTPYWLFTLNHTIITYLPNGTYSIPFSSLIDSNFSYQMTCTAEPVYENYTSFTFMGGFNFYPRQNYTKFSGSFTVDGKNKTMFINFTRLYTVTFNVNGLSKGQSVKLKVGNTTINSNSSSITLQEPNGSYEYSLDIVGGNNHFYMVAGNGTVIVDGSNVNENVSEVRLFSVEFHIVGPSNQNVSIHVGNVTLTGTGTLATYLQNGSYKYSIVTNNGYTATNKTGEFKVDNGSVSIYVKVFRQTTFNYTTYDIIGAILVIAVALAYISFRKIRKK